MAYWSETRGLTLRLNTKCGAMCFVRLTLVERRGLLGSWHNVREARAERSDDEQGLPSALGEGRMLSWRPLTHSDAEGLLAQRTRTLERIGYTVIHSSEAERAPWAWLSDLVHRQLPRSEPKEAKGEDTRVVPIAAKLPLDPDQTEADDELSITQLAARAGLGASCFEHPGHDELIQVNFDHLAPVLDEVLDSPRARLRDVAKRWLEMPAMIYELDPAMIERWLEEGSDAARLITARLPAEGLALCGEGTLRRLHQRSRSPRVRQFASKWVTRLDS